MLFDVIKHLYKMKRIVFTFIVIFIAVSTFAYVNPPKAFTKATTKTSATSHKKKAKKPPLLYWYSVNPNIATGPVTNSDVTFLDYGSMPSGGLSCTGNSPLFYCVISLNSSQVNTTTHAVIGSQYPGVYSWRGFND